MSTTYFVTGGAGFIGSNLVHYLLERDPDARVVVYDRLTYAGNLDNLTDVASDPRYKFVQGDICDRERVKRRSPKRHPTWSSISRPSRTSIARSTAPGEFVRTNVRRHLRAARGVARPLRARCGADEARASASCTSRPTRSSARSGRPGSSPRTTPYAPNSPYAASKAAPTTSSAPITRPTACPTLTTNCSNNYGPYQFPEKLIPLMILNALEGKPLPVYGDGINVRDWLYVEDHCERILHRRSIRRRPGETYNVGGNERAHEHRHRATRSATLLDELCAVVGDRGRSYRELDHLREGPPRPRSPLRDRRQQDQPRARLEPGAPASSEGIREDGAVVPRAPRLVRARSRRRVPARAARLASRRAR